MPGDRALGAVWDAPGTPRRAAAEQTGQKAGFGVWSPLESLFLRPRDPAGEGLLEAGVWRPQT